MKWNLKKRSTFVPTQPDWKAHEISQENSGQYFGTSYQVVGDLDDFVGYVRLSRHPDVLAAVDRIADLVSNMTIHLVENTEAGDKRIYNGIARKIDIEPCKNMTRKTWIYRIVSDMLLHGDGNAFLKIDVDPGTGFIDNLIPLDARQVFFNCNDNDIDYTIDYCGVTYSSDELVHFILNPDPHSTFRGIGYRHALQDIVGSLNQSDKTRRTFMSGQYMPSLILQVDALNEEMSTPEGRNAILNKYTRDTQGGRPWVLPADLVNIHQIKPLSLKDIAVIEGTEIDKKALASLFNVPQYVLGIGSFSKEEYNNFISTRIMGIGQRIAQTLTRDVLFNPDWYFRLNPRSLYSYDLTEMVAAGKEMVNLAAIDRNEWRDWVGLDPREGLDELLILENYIPTDKAGDQNKLNGGT